MSLEYRRIVGCEEAPWYTPLPADDNLRWQHAQMNKATWLERFGRWTDPDGAARITESSFLDAAAEYFGDRLRGSRHPSVSLAMPDGIWPLPQSSKDAAVIYYNGVAERIIARHPEDAPHWSVIGLAYASYRRPPTIPVHPMVKILIRSGFEDRPEQRAALRALEDGWLTVTPHVGVYYIPWLAAHMHGFASYNPIEPPTEAIGLYMTAPQGWSGVCGPTFRDSMAPRGNEPLDPFWGLCYRCYCAASATSSTERNYLEAVRALIGYGVEPGYRGWWARLFLGYSPHVRILLELSITRDGPLLLAVATYMSSTCRLVESVIEGREKLRRNLAFVRRADIKRIVGLCPALGQSIQEHDARSGSMFDIG